MATILVSLVSEQTIPNVLLIKELTGIDRYLLISTEFMEKKEKSRCIITGSGIDPARFFDPVIVVEDSLVDIGEKLRDIDFDDNDRFIVNLTGGTKIMSIGVYNFFRNRQSDIVYVPIGKNLYRKIFPEVKLRDHDIDFRLGVVDYLSSYGIDILHGDRMNTLIMPPEVTTRFFETYCQASSQDLAILDALRPYRSKKKTLITEVDGGADLLARYRIDPQKSDHLNKYETQYLTGEWFEEYVYTLLKNHLCLSDTHIGRSVSIQRQQNQVQNEFDILFTHQNALYVIECKTSIFDPQSGRNGRNLFNDILYKLAALRRDFGLLVKAYLFTLSKPGTERDQIRPEHIQRSELFNIRVVDGNCLKDVETRQQMLEKL